VDVASELKKLIEGEITQTPKELEKYSHDASLFEVLPQIVVHPKNQKDISKIVKFVAENKVSHPDLSITARGGGSGMEGGALGQSIILSFTRHFNHFKVIKEKKEAEVEPGTYYREFERETLKNQLLLPSYPASKSLATLGGMIANNAGGEKTLKHGKTDQYVKELEVVLADGNKYKLQKISKKELKEKISKENFEGEIYRKMYDLLEKNWDLVKGAKPKVAKNSAGYALWDVWDRKTFDLTKLFVGSQGTLGIITKARLGLITPGKYTKLGVLFLKNFNQIPDVVNAILPLGPEGLETFDDKTLLLALRFFPSIAKKIKGQNTISLGLQFLPEFLIGIRMLGVPKLIVLVEFTDDSESVLDEKVAQLSKIAKQMRIHHRILHQKKHMEKYWVVRRESFNLLRKNVSGKHTAPFIDDFIVDPRALPDLLPKILNILKENKIRTTIAGHAGSGNFHIIPLMDLSKKGEIDKIPKISDQVYDLIIKHGGSITAEHNDGLIRSPYLRKMYGDEVYALFEQTKKIFDPQNIFNPGKKVNSDMSFAMSHIRTKW